MNEFSQKVRFLSFVCACLIVLHHTNATLVSHPAAWNAGLHDFFCRQMCFWAVQFFFLASGFWFARGTYMDGRECYLSFILKKIKTLVVPYFIFAVISCIVITPVVIGNNLMMHRDLFDRTVLSAHSYGHLIDAIFGITGSPACNGALWYVRWLFIIFLCAPVWRFLTGYGCALVGLFCLIYGCQPGVKPFLAAHLGQAAYFFWGIFAAHFYVEKVKLNRVFTGGLIFAWLVVSAIPSVCLVISHPIQSWMPILGQIQFFLAILAVWFGCDLFGNVTRRIEKFELSCSFFIYCAHSIVWPTFWYCRKVGDGIPCLRLAA